MLLQISYEDIKADYSDESLDSRERRWYSIDRAPPGVLHGRNVTVITTRINSQRPPMPDRFPFVAESYPSAPSLDAPWCVEFQTGQMWTTTMSTSLTSRAHWYDVDKLSP